MSVVRTKSTYIWLGLSTLTLVTAIVTGIVFMWNYPGLASFTERVGVPYLVIFAALSLGIRIAWFIQGGARRKDIALLGIGAISILSIFSQSSSTVEISVAGCFLFFAIYVGLFDACLEAREIFCADNVASPVSPVDNDWLPRVGLLRDGHLSAEIAEFVATHDIDDADHETLKLFADLSIFSNALATSDSKPASQRISRFKELLLIERASVTTTTAKDIA